MDDRGGGSFVAVRRISQGLERGNTCHSSSGEYYLEFRHLCLPLLLLYIKIRIFRLRFSFAEKFSLSFSSFCFLFFILFLIYGLLFGLEV